MPIKAKITADEFNANAAIQSFYKPDGQGGYDIDLGFGNYVTQEDPTALLNAKNHVNQENAQLKQKIQVLEAEKTTAETNAATAAAEAAAKKGDFTQLQAQMQQQIEQQQAQFEAQLKQRDDAAVAATINAKSMQMATEMAGENAHFLAPLIQSRLSGEIDPNTGQIAIKLLDTMGNVDLTNNFDNFRKSFVDDPRNAAIIIQSDASGGSTPTSRPTGAEVPTVAGNSSYADLLKTPGKLKELKDSNPAEFERLRRQHLDAKDSSARSTGSVPLGSRPQRTT